MTSSYPVGSLEWLQEQAVKARQGDPATAVLRTIEIVERELSEAAAIILRLEQDNEALRKRLTELEEKIR